MSSDKIALIKQHIRTYPDFPKPGILFQDIFSVLKEPEIFAMLVEALCDIAKNIVPKVNCIVALDARGFLVGPIIALNLQIPFVPIRKKGKLPGQCKSVTYTLEYGQDVFEIQAESIKEGMTVLLVDDLLATGGSFLAACNLIKELKAEVVAGLFVIELLDLKGRDKVDIPIHSIVQC